MASSAGLVGERPAQFHPARALLLASGIAFLVTAVLYNELLLRLVDPSPPLAPDTVAAVRRGQVLFAALGFAFLTMSEVVRRVRWLAAVTRRGWVANVVLAVLSVGGPLTVLELGLEPWAAAPSTTTLFVRDSVLGWKHRPGVQTLWEGAAVQINRKGLRGPELEYRKRRGTVRVLYLGDSVLFGDKLAAYEETFPYQAESTLEQVTGRIVESVNSGVSGYSPWQELAYLRSEGLKYEPDVIVVAFVLNDVTEQFELTRFGGSWEGWQLWYARSPVRQWFAERNIWWLVQRVRARLQFGTDVPGGARERERLNVQAIVEEPDRDDVRRAWSQTLSDLDQIQSVGRARGIPVLLVAIPFAFQLNDLRPRPAPQATLEGFARERGLPYLDLLPVLRAGIAAEGLKPEQVFVDSNHLTAKGCAMVGKALANALKPIVVPDQQDVARG